MPEEIHRFRVPVVALVGRPNVGKSRLFNRFTGSSRALVEATPGVTRDRIAASIEISGREILLVDTAGLEEEDRSDLSQAVQRQAREAVEQADAILFVVDGRAGLLPEDEEIGRTLRRTSRPLAVLVNKLDTYDQFSRMAEFHRLGLQPLCGVSAEHGLGAFDAIEELVALLPALEVEPDPEAVNDAPLRIAFVGHPNVGKSTLVNRLAGSERVVVSELPGTTRDSVDVRIREGGREYDLVDTAGLRRAGRRDRLVEPGSALMTVRSLERADVALLLIDAGTGFSDQDARISNLVADSGCAMGVLANKWDCVPEGEGESVRRGIERSLRFLSHVPVLSISGLSGLRTERILGLANQVRQSGLQRVSTADLNRWLNDVVAQHEPSMAQRGSRKRRIKFFYAAQTGVAPPRFVLVCTEPTAVRPTYRRFLENRLREAFGFDGTPIRMRLRARGRGSRRHEGANAPAAGEDAE